MIKILSLLIIAFSIQGCKHHKPKKDFVQSKVQEVPRDPFVPMEAPKIVLPFDEEDIEPEEENKGWFW